MLRVYICTPTNAQFGSDGQQKTRTKTATAAAATMLAHLSDPPFFSWLSSSSAFFAKSNDDIPYANLSVPFDCKFQG